MFASVMTLTLHASESSVIAWVGGWVPTSSPRRHLRGPSSPIIPLLPTKPTTRIRPRHPCDAAREIKCPSMILYGGHDNHSTFPVQQRVMESFYSNGQPLEWH